MPEIIEVKSYVDFIKKCTSNHKLLKIKILKGRYKTHEPFAHFKLLKRKLPIKIESINTKGKFTYFKIDDLYLGVSLGLFGGWLFKKNNSEKFNYPDFYDTFDPEIASNYLDRALNHLNIEFVFENGSLFYYDQLSFGSFTVFTSQELLDKKLKQLGLDIMDPETTLEMFTDKLMKTTNLKKPIGLVLLNQKIIAGVGNYLRADLLWLCKISPFRKVSDLTNLDLKKLYKNIRLLTWASYDYKLGVKLKVIDKDDKLPIDYKNEFLVYSRDKDIYGNEITKEKLYDGKFVRHIFWVPKLQK